MKYTINIPKKETDTRVWIPYDIPTALIAHGAIELYAMKMANWTPKVISPDNVEIDNPINAVNAIAIYFRNVIKEQYKTLLKQEAIQQAQLLTDTQFDQLFN